MKTSNVHLLREIDSIEELLGVDANELLLVKEIGTLTEQVRRLREIVKVFHGHCCPDEYMTKEERNAWRLADKLLLEGTK